MCNLSAKKFIIYIINNINSISNNSNTTNNNRSFIENGSTPQHNNINDVTKQYYTVKYKIKSSNLKPKKTDCNLDVSKKKVFVTNLMNDI